MADKNHIDVVTHNGVLVVCQNRQNLGNTFNGSYDIMGPNVPSLLAQQVVLGIIWSLGQMDNNKLAIVQVVLIRWQSTTWINDDPAHWHLNVSPGLNMLTEHDWHICIYEKLCVDMTWQVFIHCYLFQQKSGLLSHGLYVPSLFCFTVV